MADGNVGSSMRSGNCFANFVNASTSAIIVVELSGSPFLVWLPAAREAALIISEQLTLEGVRL